MRICLLADSESIHTKRWCSHFLDLGYKVSLISFKDSCSVNGVDFHPINAGSIAVKGGSWKVLLKIREVKKLLKKINPDILHAHYATSYGVIGALTNFHPYIITALGSDVLISPKNSIVYRLLLRFAFNRADWITVMADHMKSAMNTIGEFNDKTEVVPFGIDTKLFNAKSRKLNEEAFVITSTRNFEDVYNIPHLLKAVALVKDKIPNLKLNLIGDGTKRDQVEELIKELNLGVFTQLYGRIEQHEMVNTLKESHVFISVSLSDGNNISLNEAMSCGCYPIVTNIDANTQWIENGNNGFLVEINDVNRLSELILEAHTNFKELSDKAFIINQAIISDKADWYKNLKIVENKYTQLVNGKK